MHIDQLLESPPPAEDAAAALEKSNALLQDWESQRKVLDKLYEKQKVQGGIIDLSKMGAKLLVISESSNRRADIAGDDANSFLETDPGNLFPPGGTANQVLSTRGSHVESNDTQINGNSECNTSIESGISDHGRPTVQDNSRAHGNGYCKDRYRNHRSHETYRGKRRHK